MAGLWLVINYINEIHVPLFSFLVSALIHLLTGSKFQLHSHLFKIYNIKAIKVGMNATYTFVIPLALVQYKWWQSK